VLFGDGSGLIARMLVTGLKKKKKKEKKLQVRQKTAQLPHYDRAIFGLVLLRGENVNKNEAGLNSLIFIFFFFKKKKKTFQNCCPNHHLSLHDQHQHGQATTHGTSNRGEMHLQNSRKSKTHLN
jgi:hypothetical protein